MNEQVSYTSPYCSYCKVDRWHWLQTCRLDCVVLIAHVLPSCSAFLAGTLFDRYNLKLQMSDEWCSRDLFSGWALRGFKGEGRMRGKPFLVPKSTYMQRLVRSLPLAYATVCVSGPLIDFFPLVKHQ